MIRVRCGTLIAADGPITDGEVGVEGADIAYAGRWRRESDSVIDWSAWTVMPGMIDSHDHLGVDMRDEEEQAREHPAYTTAKALGNARTLLRAGVTTLRDLGESHESDLWWRTAFATGVAPGPRLLVAGRFITATGGHAWYAGDQADGPTAVRQAVRRRSREGCDLVKLMITGGISTAGTDPLAPGYTREEICACVEEAHSRGMKVAAHGHGGPAVTWALEAGVDSIEHGVYLSVEQLQLCKRTGTFLVVTYGVIEQAARSADVPAPYRTKAAEAIRRYDRTLRAAAEVGVSVAVGGDGWHGDPALELGALVRNGFSNADALAAVTHGAAGLLGLEGRVGTVEVGKAADLVALDGDPLDDIGAVGRIRGVMHDGQVMAV